MRSKNDSMGRIHITLWKKKKKKLRASISRNEPPNAAIDGYAISSWCEYATGSFNAISSTDCHGVFAATATSAIGNTTLIPKMAIKMPIVKNIVCQNRDMAVSTLALMMAFSKLNVISITSSANSTGIITAP